MNIHLKRGIRIVIFVMVFSVLLNVASDVLKPKYINGNSETINFNYFYNLPKDSIEVCSFGTSVITCGIDTYYLYGNYGISCANLGTSIQPVVVSYMLLKQAYKRQNIKVAIFDVSSLFETPTEFNYKRTIDTAPFSIDKLQAIFTHKKYGTNEDINVSEYLFDIIEYHSRWSELTEEDFDYNNDTADKFYAGFRIKAKISNEGLTQDDIIVDNDELDLDSAVISEENLKSFNDIINYTKENNIGLILIKTPKADWNLSYHTVVQEIADENDLTFFDFNTEEMINEIDYNVNQHQRDLDHLNTRGADLITEYLGNYISNNYDISYIEESDEHFPDDYDNYIMEMEQAYANSCIDVSEFLKAINNERYNIIIQSTGDISDIWTDEYQELIENLGVNVNIANLSEKNYAFLCSNGKCITQKISENSITLDDTLTDGETFSLTTDCTSDKTGNIKIISKEKTFNKSGISFSVYDTELGRTILFATLYNNNDKLTLCYE